MLKRILVTGTGGDVAVGIVKCILSDMPQAVLFSCDIKPIVPYLNCFEKHFVAPRYDSDDYLPAIKKACLDYEITHFFPTTEPEILIANKHKDFFGENDILLVINNQQILDVATSKYKTAAFLRENGVNVPETYLPDKLPSIIDYPMVVKPDFGRGSAYLIKINNQQDLDNALAVVPSPVIQKYVGTAEQEFTVGVFSNGHSTRSISYRRTLGIGNMSVFVEVVQDPKLEQIAHTVAQIFCLKGAFNIQLRLHEGKYYIFEVNPRISSTVAFRHQMGFKDVIWWLQTLNGDPIEDFNIINAGVTGIKLDTEQILYPPFNNVEKL